MKKHITFLLSFSLLCVSAARAAPPHDHAHAQEESAASHSQQSHGAHVHGEAKLSIAQEGSQVDILLDSPAVNIVGFETSTGSPEQKTIIQRAQKRLEEANKLFAFRGGDCVVQSTSADLSKLRQPSTSGSNEEKHRDIEVHFRYHCSAPDTLSALDVHLFNAFIDIERLSVQWVTDKGQGAQSLTKRSHRLTLN